MQTLITVKTELTTAQSELTAVQSELAAVRLELAAVNSAKVVNSDEDELQFELEMPVLQ